MSEKLSKLNRLRANAGKGELKSWKASQQKLDEAISMLETAGFTDVLPGANTEAAAVTEDPEVAAARTEVPEKKATQCKPGLGRGLHDEKYAVHSRKAVHDHREKERKDRKLKLTDEDKAQIENEAKLRKGEVDPKKDPKKAERQKKHIEEKKAKREAAGNVGKKKEVGKDEISVADIARSLNIDPKIARAKLRRYEDKPDYPKTVKGERWVFPKSAEKAIMKILK